MPERPLSGRSRRGTIALPWGPPCRPYVFNEGHCRRIAVGPIALTYVPDVEIDDLMEAWADAAVVAAQVAVDAATASSRNEKR